MLKYVLLFILSILSFKAIGRESSYYLVGGVKALSSRHDGGIEGKKLGYGLSVGGAMNLKLYSYGEIMTGSSFSLINMKGSNLGENQDIRQGVIDTSFGYFSNPLFNDISMGMAISTMTGMGSRLAFHDQSLANVVLISPRLKYTSLRENKILYSILAYDMDVSEKDASIRSVSLSFGYGFKAKDPIKESLYEDNNIKEISLDTPKDDKNEEKIALDASDNPLSLTQETSKVEEPKIFLIGSHFIKFSYYSSHLNESALSYLSCIANVASLSKAKIIAIHGHSSKTTKDMQKQNLIISLRRAEEVRAFFVNIGDYSISEIKVFGYGEKYPLKNISSPYDPAHRRVEIEIYGTENDFKHIKESCEKFD